MAGIGDMPTVQGPFARIRNALLGVRSQSADTRRRGGLLIILLCGAFLAVLSTTVVNGLGMLLGIPDLETEVLLDFITVLVTLVLWFVARQGFVRPAAYLALLLWIAVVALGFAPAEVASLGITFVPAVIAAAFVIAPPASFLFAGVAAGGYILSLARDPAVANGPNAWPMMNTTLFLLSALVAWLAARSLERALQGEREQTAKVRQAYEESTARAKELAETLQREHEVQSGQARPDDPRVLQGLSQRLWQGDDPTAGTQVARVTDSLEDVARSVAAEFGVPPEQVIALVAATAKERAAGQPRALPDS